MPLPGSSPSALWRNGVDEAPTGSIAKTPETLSPALDAEDWRRASAALATALDPQGAGDGVNWDNPKSGARGVVAPVGAPFPREGRVCRSYRAEIATRGQRESVEGAACRDKTAEWTLDSATRKKL